MCYFGSAHLLDTQVLGNVNINAHPCPKYGQTAEPILMLEFASPFGSLKHILT